MSLLQVLVAVGLSGILLMATTRFLANTQRAERGIASNSEFEQFVQTLNLILNHGDSCARSGLVGLTLNPAAITPASPAAVDIHLPGPTGPGAVLAEAGRNIGTSRTIGSLGFTSLVPLGPPDGLGNRFYFGTLSLRTRERGNVLTTRNPDREFFLRLQLNAANQVIQCTGRSESQARLGISGSGRVAGSRGAGTCSGIDAETNVGSGWSLVLLSGQYMCGGGSCCGPGASLGDAAANGGFIIRDENGSVRADIYSASAASYSGPVASAYNCASSAHAALCVRMAGDDLVIGVGGDTAVNYLLLQ